MIWCCWRWFCWLVMILILVLCWWCWELVIIVCWGSMRRYWLVVCCSLNVGVGIVGGCIIGWYMFILLRSSCVMWCYWVKCSCWYGWCWCCKGVWRLGVLKCSLGNYLELKWGFLVEMVKGLLMVFEDCRVLWIKVGVDIWIVVI